jgi:nucleoside-diphosphate-sugar epimerase
MMAELTKRVTTYLMFDYYFIAGQSVLFTILELVEADLMDRDSLYQAVEGCAYVIHVASPVPLTQPDDEDEVVKPAVEGTKTIF